MRHLIALLVIGSILVALAVLVGTRKAADDELAVSIERLVQTSR
jgi:hypothetical protein